MYVAPLAGIEAACPDASTIRVNTFEQGATSPDWGPADLPGPRPEQPKPDAPKRDAPKTGRTERPRSGEAARRDGREVVAEMGALTATVKLH